MATNANTTAVAKRNALRRVNTIQAVKPTHCQQTGKGCIITTYTSAKLGCCQVLARLVNAAGMVTAYRVKHNGQPHIVPAGNLAAIGTLFVPYALM